MGGRGGVKQQSPVFVCSAQNLRLFSVPGPSVGPNVLVCMCVCVCV